MQLGEERLKKRRTHHSRVNDRESKCKVNNRNGEEPERRGEQRKSTGYRWRESERAGEYEEGIKAYERS